MNPAQSSGFWSDILRLVSFSAAAGDLPSDSNAKNLEINTSVRLSSGIFHCVSSSCLLPAAKKAPLKFENDSPYEQTHPLRIWRLHCSLCASRGVMAPPG